MKKSLIALALPMLLAGQVKPPVDSWPTYNGDYSGQRFSPLKQINQLNVKALTLAWVYHPSGGQTPGAIVGGLGPEVPPVAGRETGFGGLQIKATPLMLNGILYFATPDNAGPSTPAQATKSGITSGRPRAVFTSGIAGSGSSRTGSSLKRPTIISFHSTRGPARSAGMFKLRT